MGATVTALLALSPRWLSGQLTGSVREFGPIGVTFVLAGWLLIFSTLVIPGIVAGAWLVAHRAAKEALA